MTKLGTLQKRRRLSPDQRAAQLHEIAIELFAEKGLGRVGHGDIAKRAGVSTGTVFNYFPTTESLNELAMVFVSDKTLEIFEGDISGIERGMNRDQTLILIYGQRLLALVESHPNCLKIFLNWSHSYGDPFRERFLSVKQNILRHIEQNLSQRDSLEIDAKIIFGTGVLLAQMKIENEPAEELQRFAIRVAQLIG